jgi:lipopolysaccharide transport system ATP-binding protein
MSSELHDQQDREIGAITLCDVSKVYHIYERPQDRLKQALCFHRRKYGQEFWALRNINLHVAPGSAWGIIGRNGAGKSTLLQLIAGTLTPTLGSIQVNGRVAAMLELGAGFNPEYTGRENVFFAGSIAGIARAQMEQRVDDIAAFADIGPFLDQSVKTYSTGMFARLAFSVAVCTDPDILLVDEILSVGDAEFQQRCILRVRKLRENGVTLLLSSHSMDTIKSACDKALLLEDGQIRHAGSATDCTDRYWTSVREAMNQQHQEDLAMKLARIADRRRPAGSRRYGSGHAYVESVRLLDAAGQDAAAFQFADPVTLDVRYRCEVPMSELSISFLVRDATGIDIFGTTTFDESVPLPPCEGGHRGCVRFRFVNPLRAGTYGISVAINRVTRRDLSDVLLLDQIDDAVAFETLGKLDRPVWYKVHVPIQVIPGGASEPQNPAD